MTSYRTVLFSAVVLVVAAMPAAPAVADSVPAVFKSVTVRSEPATTRTTAPVPGAWLDVLRYVMLGVLPLE